MGVRSHLALRAVAAGLDSVDRGRRSSPVRILEKGRHMGLTQINEGAVGWAATMNANIAFLRLPPSFIQGLGIAYTDSTHFTVRPGNCRDSSDSTDMALAA